MTTSLESIAPFLASTWFKDASRKAMAGDLSNASLIYRPSENGRTFHPIITWEPDSFDGWMVATTISPALSERQVSGLTHASLRTCPIL